jgi:hypothetical protein
LYGRLKLEPTQAFDLDNLVDVLKTLLGLNDSNDERRVVGVRPILLLRERATMTLEVERLSVEAPSGSTAAERRVLCPVDDVLGLFLRRPVRGSPCRDDTGRHGLCGWSMLKSPWPTFELSRGIMIP